VCETPISKITWTKWLGGVVPVVELLLCKYEALSLNPQAHQRVREGSVDNEHSYSYSSLSPSSHLPTQPVLLCQWPLHPHLLDL
jgi:hypothetical protein